MASKSERDIDNTMEPENGQEEQQQQQQQPPPEPQQSGAAPAVAAAATAATSSASKTKPAGFLKRILELFLLLCATLAALFFFKEAEDAQAEKRKLESELRRVRAAGGDQASGPGGKCAVCMDNPLEVSLEPCGHVCLCRDCGEKVVKCPICRARIDRKREVFLAT